jgi:7-cyano-7-deazaguanine synthase in queuosine biosynthesis
MAGVLPPDSCAAFPIAMHVNVVEQGDYSKESLSLVPGKNLLTGANELTSAVGKLTSLEEDLLTVASAIFATDLAVVRGEREGFVREIELNVPVVNHQAFRYLKQQLDYLLYVLSSDNWNVNFSQKKGAQEPSVKATAKRGRTILFSGGLDSFAGAIKELQDGHPLQLVSHYTRNRVIRESQEALAQYLHKQYGPKVSRVAVRATGRKSGHFWFPSDTEREPSQRTRSLLFMVLAAISARKSGFHEIVVIAENGQMAIHLPLTAARIGAFSTHTAHPEVIYEVQKFLSDLLSFPIEIINPFVYLTKAECISGLFKLQSHQNLIPQSVSCWRASRVGHAHNHCGECVPCLVRRIAIEHNELKIPEYDRDLFREDIAALVDGDTGKRNLVELAEFIARFDSTTPEAALLVEFPDLINEQVDSSQAISMYRRFAGEARHVLSSYSLLGALLR